ncbi:hypothetical protein SLEX105133_03290 [Slackia exigua]|nr:Uncharacterised protein [Slackia exigua]
MQPLQRRDRRASRRQSRAQLPCGCPEPTAACRHSPAHPPELQMLPVRYCGPMGRRCRTNCREARTQSPPSRPRRGGPQAGGRRSPCPSQRLRASLQAAWTDWNMQRVRNRPIYVEEGMPAGRCGVRGLLRASQKQALLPQVLGWHSKTSAECSMAISPAAIPDGERNLWDGKARKSTGCS